MKWISLVLAALAALFWGAVLLTNIPHLDLIACVMLPEQSISGTLWFQVVFPTAMLTLAAAVLVVTAVGERPSRAVLALLCVSLAGVLVYYGEVTGLSITQRSIDACRPWLEPER